MIVGWGVRVCSPRSSLWVKESSRLVRLTGIEDDIGQ